MKLDDTFAEELSRRTFLKRSIRSSIAIASGPALMSTLTSCSKRGMMKTPSMIDPRHLDKRMSDNFKRLPIAHIPTPLEYMKRLSDKLGGPRIFMKRDDQTGLAFGGNKTRKLEFILADAIEKKCDSIITWGGVQSNWCRQTVAGAKMFGLKPILVLSKKDDAPPSYDGNLLLDAIMGADIRFVEPGEDRGKIAEKVTEEVKEKGQIPYVVSVGGSHVGYSMTEPLGAMSYTKAFLEIYSEAQKRRMKISHIVHATGSGGTQGGLCTGALVVDPRIKIVGISIGGDKASGQSSIVKISNKIAETLGLGISIHPEEVIVFDDYVGDGYGILNQATVDAILLLARAEGILLDPVYTGKAMSGLIDLIKNRTFKKSDHVVFIHTGGTPALFPYGKELLEYLRKGDVAYYKDFYSIA